MKSRYSINYIIVTLLISSQAILQNMNLTVRNVFGLNDTTFLTVLFYFLIVMLSVYYAYKNRIFSLKRLSIIVLFYSVFIISFLIFADTRNYFLQQEMLIIYLTVIPTTVFIFPTLKDFSILIKLISMFALVLIPWSFLGFLFLDYQIAINYMAFSYALLPLILATFFIFQEEKSIIMLIIFLLGTIAIFMFGSRAVFFAVFIYVILVFIVSIFSHPLRFNKKFYFKYIAAFSILAVFLLFISASPLQKIFVDSRIFAIINQESFFQDEARENIYSIIINSIEDSNFKVHGLFGDRLILEQYTSETAYSHNFFLEITVSTGLIGILLSFWLLLYMIFKFIRVNSFGKKAIIYLTISFFLRYMVSGSFIEEPMFYIFLTLIILINNNLSAKSMEIQNKQTIHP
jgi:O-antigen ligase